MVNQAGENIISVAPGANGCLSPADIQAAAPAIRKAHCLLVQLEIPLPAVLAALEVAAQHRVPTILNPAPAAQLPADLLKLVDYLTPNETEAAALVGGYAAADVKGAAYLLKSKHHLKNIVVTLGKRGALIAGYQDQIIPARSVNAVDTTGAGDAFNGGLAVALARGDGLVDAVRFANAVAALSTTRPGAQSSMPTLEEVQSFMAGG
jgi:ribokinase